jgi:hypothetical protein
MKYLITFVLAAGLGFAAAYLTITKPNQAQPSSASTESSETIPATPQSPALKSIVVESNSPVDILQKLSQLNPAKSKNPARTVRQIIHQLESLTDAGEDVIPAISLFIKTGADMEYILQEKNGPTAPFWNWHPGQPLFSGLVLPPSLRLSLVDVLKNIGGEKAETALGVMLATSTRPVEVAYVSAVLEKMAPGKFKEVGNSSAKHLLENPAQNSSGSPLDEHNDANLYNVLNMNGDNSLVEAAQAKLMNNGRYDADAGKYLVGALKEQAMPVLAKAYATANAEDKNVINNQAFTYVGNSADANAIFKNWILDNSVDPATQAVYAKPRPTFIELLAGGNTGLFRAPVPTDPTVIANRINLLTDINNSLPPSNLKQVVGATIQKLKGLPGAP